jgi:hypothetical protein
VTLDEHVGYRSDEETYSSPFAGLASFSEPTAEHEKSPTDSGESPFEAVYFAESPFSAESYSEADEQAAFAEDFLEALHDEQFEDALDELMNEGAARVLADAQQWSATPSESEVSASLDEWIGPLVTEWERLIDGFSAGLENTSFEGMPEHELDELLESLETYGPLESEIFGKIVRGLANKAKSLIKHAVQFAKNPIKGVVNIAKAGLGTIADGLKGLGKGLLGPLLQKLKRAGLSLLKGVLKKLMKPLSQMLPSAVRPFIPILMNKLGLGEADETTFGEDHESELGVASALAEAFDHEVMALLTMPEADEDSGYGAEQSYLAYQASTESPYETGYEYTGEYPNEENQLAALDDARARLAVQLSEHNGAQPPIAEIEQFIPVVLAIRPLLKLGLKLTGKRDALINLIARPLAGLIKAAIGPANARQIARVIGQEPDKLIARTVVGLGFTTIGLETATSAESAIPGEALASTVEATVMRVLEELAPEAQSDALQVSAAVQRAFSESAAAYLPDRMLREDLPERETSHEAGFWIMMPRSTAPQYRFRKYTRIFAVPITRQAARAIRWSDGGTLETYLLDRGVPGWPVQAEVDLYETMPGTFVGQLTRDETLPAGENPLAEDFQPLTPEVAGLLLSQPALGRSRNTVTLSPGSYRPLPGQRYFRVRVAQFPARRVRRPRRLVSVRWNPSDKRLRIAIRLSERRARLLQAKIQRSAPAGQRDLPSVLAVLREILLPRLQHQIARRLARSAALDPAAASALAGTIAAATSTGISTYLVQRSAQLAAAVADPAEGVTITVTFKGLVLSSKTVPAPEVVTHPGWLDA